MLLDADAKALQDLSPIEGGLARFAARRRFAKAFNRHFGEALSLDGRQLQRVAGLGSLSDAFAVLSDQPAEAARRLTPELLTSMRQAWSVWADIGVTRPWIGVCGDRIAIACVQDRPADLAQVAALIEIGSAVAGARD